MVDEQAVLADLAKFPGIRETGIFALLDAKDAEIDNRDSLILTALSRAEQAEAALAEERKAHQAFREGVSAAVADVMPWLQLDWSPSRSQLDNLSRFILPAKPADSLVEAAKAICKEDGQDWDTLEQTYNGRQRQHDYKRFARAAIERAGGTISFEGEG